MLKLIPIAALLGFGHAEDPAVCPSPCKDDDQATLTADPAYDADADADVFSVYALAPELCDTAREMIADGTAEDEMIDAAVLVFIDEGLIETPEGVYYLRGVLRGCVA